MDVDIEVTNFPHGRVLEQLSSFGFVQSCNYSVENIASSNPASPGNFSTITAGISYQYVSNIEPGWFSDIDYNRAFSSLPQSFGAVIPVDKFLIGLGASQRYNSQIDFGDLEITTINAPDGTSETYAAEDNTLISSLAATVSYSLHSVFKDDDALGLGFQLNRDRLDYRSKRWHADLKTKGYSNSYSIGIHYKQKRTLNPGLLELGLFFEKGTSFKEKKTYETQGLLDPIDIDPGDASHFQFVGPAVTEWTIVAKTPDKINAGILFSSVNRLYVSLNAALLFRNQINTQWKNTIEYSGGLIYYLSEAWILSVGNYYAHPRSDLTDAYFKDMNRNMEVNYITGGIRFQSRHYAINASVADSHLFSGKWRRHTIARFGVSVTL